MQRKLIALIVSAMMVLTVFGTVFGTVVVTTTTKSAAATSPLSTYAAAGHTYYVSPTGNNSNNGSFTSPWATPGYGSKQLHPGDTLIIRGGRYVLSTYFDDQITPPSGNATAWTTVKGEAGNRPVLVGRDNLLSAIEIDDNGYLKNNAYLRIENLEVTSDNGAPFRGGICGGPSLNHVIFNDLYIHHVDQMGIGGWGDVNDLKILNCTVTYCGGGGIGGPTGAQGGWRNVLVDHCTLSYAGHYYQGTPQSPDERPDGYGVEPSNGPVEIAHTTVTHNRGDGIDSKSNNTYIHHCTVANNNGDHVKLWGTGSTVENTLIYGRGDGNAQRTNWSPIVLHGEPNARFAITNVAVDDALGGNYLMHVNYDDPTYPVVLNVTNTIFCGRGANSPIFLGSGVNFTFRNNLFWMPNTDHVLERGTAVYTASQVGNLGPGNKYGDPLFVSPAWGATGDYHFKAGSPAIDAGTATGAPSTDLDGEPRPHGKGYDIGAYEYLGNYPPARTTLTAAAPAAAFVNQKFIINGTLSASTVGLADATITLQRSTNNATWGALTTTTTNATGGYQFGKNEATAGSYYYRTAYDGNATYANATSNVVTVLVTQATTPLAITSVDPANNTVNVPVTTAVYATFNKTVEPGTNYSNITLKKGTVKVNAPATIAGNKLTIKPNATLSYNTAYTVLIPKDGVKNGTQTMTSDFTSTFTTVAASKTATSLNATAPATANATQNFTVRGNLTSGGKPLAGQSITLQRSTDNTTWTNVTRPTTNTTNPTGGYSFSRNETASGVYYYRATYAGNGTYANATSNVVKVTISRIPTTLTAVAASSAYVTKYFTVTGRLTANGAGVGGKTITLQRSTDTKTWSTLASKSADGTGRYTFSRAETTARTYYYRTVYAGTDTLASATSSVVSVKVVNYPR